MHFVMTEGEVFSSLPCLSSGCLDWRADRCRRKVGEFYLRSLAGEKLSAPTLDEVLAGCCRVERAGMTFLTPGVLWMR